MIFLISLCFSPAGYRAMGLAGLVGCVGLGLYSLSYHYFGANHSMLFS